MKMENFEVGSLTLKTELCNLSPILPEAQNQEFFRRNQELEKEIYDLKVELENSKTETIFLKSSNEGLKTKIGELFQDAQTNLEQKLKLENSLKDMKCQIAVIENSSKWYQSRLHESEAVNKSLKTDLEAYDKVLIQREQTINDLTSKVDKFNKLESKYEFLESRYRKDYQEYVKELELLRDERNSPECRFFDSKKLDFIRESEEEHAIKIRDFQKQLEIFRTKFSNSEVARVLAETSLSKCRKAIETVEEKLRENKVEKAEVIEKLRIVEADEEGLRSDNERLRMLLLSSKKDQCQVEEGIIQLRLQLTKMIAQYKSLKLRNSDFEKKLSTLQEVQSENERLKSQTIATRNSLLRKIDEEKRKLRIAENLLTREREKVFLSFHRERIVSSMRVCLQQALEREKDLKERLRNYSKGTEESIDEGYADGTGFLDVSLVSPVVLDPRVLSCAVELVNKSKNFLGPLQSDLDKLKIKMEKLEESRCLKSL